MAGSIAASAGIFCVCVLALGACTSGASSDDAAAGNADSGAETSDAASDGASEGRDGGVDAADASPLTSLTLTGCPQAGYTASLAIGGSPFDLVIDTGSAELGVASSTCTTCGSVTPVYLPGASATDEHMTADVSYVSGTSWSGEIYSDDFGAASGAPSAKTRLVAITAANGFFDAASCGLGTIPFSFEGIAGFGPSGLIAPGTDAPLASLASAGMPDIFSLALCGLGGQMWLGGFDPASASAPPKYSPLLAGDYYAVEVNDVKVGASALGFTAADIHDVVVDSDTTEFEVPTSVYNATIAAIGNDASFQQHFGGAAFFDNANCIAPLDASPPTPDALDAALPKVSLLLDDGAGGSIEVVLNATTSYLEPITKNGTTYYCPEIETNGGGSTVLGSAFVRGEVIVYDVADARVGFAPYAGCVTR